MVSFDIINMFPTIDNMSELNRVKSVLDARHDQFSACIIKDLKLCLECKLGHFFPIFEKGQG